MLGRSQSRFCGHKKRGDAILISAATARRLCQYIVEKLAVEATLDGIGALRVARRLAAQAARRMELFADPDPGRSGEAVACYRMHAAWLAFTAVGDLGWPAYDLNRRATMCCNVWSQVAVDPQPVQRALWEGVR